MRKNRIDSDDKRSVELMLDSKEFPEPLFMASWPLPEIIPPRGAGLS